MRMNFIRKEVFAYVNENVKPLYKTFDKAHNLSHFKFVTENCVEHARELAKRGIVVNLEIAYMVGALHDIGITKGRDGHAKSSGEMVRNDTNLRTLYSEGEIEMIAQAVEDHSSHLEYEPRSIYGKIVADSDRNNSVYLVFSRPIKYGIKHEKGLDRQGHINKVYDFVQNKFGRNGHVKYWLDISETRKEQQKVWSLLDNEELCKMYIGGIFDEITKGKIK